MWTLVVITFTAAVLTLVCANPPCMSDSDCGANQCCYKRPQFLIVSRRQLPDDLVNHKGFTGICMTDEVDKANDTYPSETFGVCEDFQPTGTPCSPFDKMNGHCSCAQGLTCRFVAAETTTQGIVRRKLYYPGPGSYQCATPEH